MAKRPSMFGVGSIITTIIFAGILIVALKNSHPIALSFKENLKLAAYHFDVLLWEKDHPFNAYGEKDTVIAGYMRDMDFTPEAVNKRNETKKRDMDVLELLLKVYYEKNGKYPLVEEVEELTHKLDLFSELKKYTYRVPRDPSGIIDYKIISDPRGYILIYEEENLEADGDISLKRKYRSNLEININDFPG